MYDSMEAPPDHPQTSKTSHRSNKNSWGVMVPGFWPITDVVPMHLVVSASSVPNWARFGHGSHLPSRSELAMGRRLIFVGFFTGRTWRLFGRKSGANNTVTPVQVPKSVSFVPCVFCAVLFWRVIGTDDPRFADTTKCNETKKCISSNSGLDGAHLPQ